MGSEYCGVWINSLKWIPVLFLVCMITWSYYVYVIQFSFMILTSYVEKIIYLLGYHIIFAIFIWAYWKTIFTPIATVPKKFELPSEELDKIINASNEQTQTMIIEAFAQTLPVSNRTISGAIRYCEKCQHVKPDRAHHCSVCRVCVLKMDHHCPWVNNCVSFTNYKFFILFLGYAFLYCIYILLTTFRYFIMFWKNPQGAFEGAGKYQFLILFFVAGMFATSLVSLFVYHCYLVSKNRTTLEAFRAPVFISGPDKNGFSLGRYNNFQEVFGDRRAFWFLPIFTSLGDGTDFRTSICESGESSYSKNQSAGDSATFFGSSDGETAQDSHTTYQSLGDGVTYPVRTDVEMGHDSLIRIQSFGDGINFPQRAYSEDTDHLLNPRQWDEDEIHSSSVLLN